MLKSKKKTGKNRSSYLFLFMGWVMGLEPVIIMLKTVGITNFSEFRVQFRVQICLSYKEIAKVLCTVGDVFLRQVGVYFPHCSIV